MGRGSRGLKQRGSIDAKVLIYCLHIYVYIYEVMTHVIEAMDIATH